MHIIRVSCIGSCFVLLLLLKGCGWPIDTNVEAVLKERLSRLSDWACFSVCISLISVDSANDDRCGNFLFQ